MKKLISTKFFHFLLVIIVFGVLVFWNPRSLFSPFSRATAFFLNPFEKGIYALSLKVSSIGESLSSIGKIKKENEALFKNNVELSARVAQLEDQKRENDFLRSQLELLPRGQYELISASVVSQDQGGLGNWIGIDKGSNQGLVKNMPVIISNSILVGKIDEVYGNSAKVMLLSNPKSAVNGVISASEAKGIIRGEYGLGIILDMVMQSDKINIGDDVITSGIGGDTPRGLLIGKVRQVQPSEDHLFQQAIISPAIQTDNLSTVFIIKSNK